MWRGFDRVAPTARENGGQVRLDGFVALRTQTRQRRVQGVRPIGAPLEDQRADIRRSGSGSIRPDATDLGSFSTAVPPTMTRLLTIESVLASKSIPFQRSPAISPRLNPDSASSHACPIQSVSIQASNAWTSDSV